MNPCFGHAIGIGTRRKQPGRFRGLPGGQSILAFRCIHRSYRLDELRMFRANPLVVVM